MYDQHEIALSSEEAKIFSQVLVDIKANYRCVPMPNNRFEFRFYKGQGIRKALLSARGQREFTKNCPV